MVSEISNINASKLSHEQEVRYSRNISLPEISEDGQAKLLATKVLVVGAGGLGSPLMIYLAAAGIGYIGIIDHDIVAMSNLQRQIIYETDDVGHAKVTAASDSIYNLNPDIKTQQYNHKIDIDNADDIIKQYDIIADCSDNFATRFLLAEKCFAWQKPLISAAMIGFNGQISNFKPYLGAGHPCYRCFCPEIPPADAMPKCSESGVIGALGGVMGSLQAAEIIKEILQIGDSLSGYILHIDLLQTKFRKAKLPKVADCSLCGDIT